MESRRVVNSRLSKLYNQTLHKEINDYCPKREWKVNVVSRPGWKIYPSDFISATNAWTVKISSRLLFLQKWNLRFEVALTPLGADCGFKNSTDLQTALTILVFKLRCLSLSEQANFLFPAPHNKSKQKKFNISLTCLWITGLTKIDSRERAPIDLFSLSSKQLQWMV